MKIIRKNKNPFLNLGGNRGLSHDHGMNMAVAEKKNV